MVAVATLSLAFPAFCTQARAQGIAPKEPGTVHVSSSPASGPAEVAAPSPTTPGSQREDMKAASASNGSSSKPGISVHVVEGARVLIDGADAGHVDPEHPFELTLPPGDYTVRVVYDGGSNEKRKVLVTEGHVTSLEFRELPSSRVIFEKRDRWLMGFSGGGGVIAPDMKGDLGPQFEGGLLLARALSKAVEFRTLIGLHGWVAETRALQENNGFGTSRVRGLGLTATVEPNFVFHLGSIYTMGVGVAGRLGVGIPLENHLVTFRTEFLAGVAARFSPLGFAFGENREHHIELVGGAGASTARGFGLDLGELRYSFLFL